MAARREASPPAPKPNLHLAAYWLGRNEALLEMHADGALDMPGIFRESLEGQRDHWRALLDENAVDRAAFRGRRGRRA